MSTVTSTPNFQTPLNKRRETVRVIHFVDPAGAADRLWGKENVIVSLMEAQRASGRVEPELVTFTAGLLDEKMRAAGFQVTSLQHEHQRFPLGAFGALRAVLASGPPAIVHSHEYKANIVARIARLAGARMRRHVATCHGWVDRTRQLDVYYALDRISAVCTDAVTVTDPSMLALFPPIKPRRLVFVQNAIPQLPLSTSSERLAARADFGFSPDSIVIGSMGRLTRNKGILDILAAARRTQASSVVWAIAGSGAVSGDVESCGLTNVRYVGYQSDSVRYLAALDVYLQASYFEGLSLSLLEAMRAGLPSISTRAGATEFAIRDRRESLLMDAGNTDALVAAALEMARDPELRASLGHTSRIRFEEAFCIERQHDEFLKLYLG